MSMPVPLTIGLLHGLCEHRGRADAQSVGNGVLHGLPFEMDRSLFRIFADDRRQIQRLNRFGRREYVGLGDVAVLRQSRFLELREFDALGSALHFGSTAGHDDFAFLGIGIGLHSGTRVRSQLSGGILERDGRFRIRRRPVWRSEIDRPGADVDGDAGRLVAGHRIFFDGDERVGLDGVGRAITEGDAGDAFRSGLDEIAFVERGVEVGLNPIDRVHFFHENFAVEVDEFRLGLAGGDGFAVAVVDGGADFLDGVLVEVGADEVEDAEDDRGGDDDVDGYGFVSDRVSNTPRPDESSDSSRCRKCGVGRLGSAWARVFAHR